MAGSDILLNDGDGNWLTLDATVIQSRASDLILDSQARRGANTSGLRRALVHDQQDGLTINYNGDYPGGVSLVGVSRLNLRPRTVDGGSPKLPKSAAAGDVVLVHTVTRIGNQIVGEDSTVWICVGQALTAINPVSQWRPLLMGDAVDGTE